MAKYIAAGTCAATAISLILRSLRNKSITSTHPSRRIFSKTLPPNATRVQQFTASGTIEGFRGRLVPTAPERIHFRGIPYAAPLTGRNALLPPEKPDPWTETLDCTIYGAAVPQIDPSSSTLSIFGAPGTESLNYGETDENCLHLNVTVPPPPPPQTEKSGSESYYQRNHHTRTLLPVVVWIHGGANKQGSNAESGIFLDAHAFGDEEVISVSMNYRLGLAGFGHLTTDNIHNKSQNLGLKDIHLSLEWVQTNIMQFGGDPNNVTIIGQSAGAVNISALLASPTAPHRLFHKAVLSSGGPNDVPLDVYNNKIKPGLFNLNVDGMAMKDNTEVLESSVDEPTPLLLEGLEYGETGGGGITLKDYQKTESKDILLDEHNVGLSPSMWCHVSGMGGDDDVLPHPILKAVKHGSAQKIPLLIGHASNEFPAFLRVLLNGKGIPDSISNSMVTEIFKRGGIGSLKHNCMLRHALHDFYGQTTDETLKNILNDLKKKLQTDLKIDDENEITARLVNLLATAPANALAVAQASTGSPVWTYEIDLDPKDTPYGNFHGIDLILLFCNAKFYLSDEHEMMSKLFFGRNTFGKGIEGASDRWRSTLIHFARNGNPGDDFANALSKDGQGETTVIGSNGDVSKSSGGRYYIQSHD